MDTALNSVRIPADLMHAAEEVLEVDRGGADSNLRVNLPPAF